MPFASLMLAAGSAFFRFFCPGVVMRVRMTHEDNVGGSGVGKERSAAADDVGVAFSSLDPAGNALRRGSFIVEESLTL